MKSASEVVATVIDHGLFLPIALKLTEHFKEVRYWSPFESAFPTIREGLIGSGFEKLIRVANPFQDSNLFIFPDIGFAELQRKLITDGFLVWGSRNGSVMEINRGAFLAKLTESGLPVPNWTAVDGLTNLRSLLEGETDKYVKISKWRGDVETFHWRDQEQDEGLLDFYATHLGPAKELVRFYVFDPIDTDIEDGVDTYCIDGQLPSVCFHGMECKDKAFLGTITKFEDIAPEVRMVTEKFAPILAEYGYRNFFSTEVRIADGQSYFIDPTLRAASPPHQVQTELFGNLGEIIWRGAQGECIDPEPTATFGVQAAIEVKAEASEWRVLKVPDELRQWVKCGMCAEIDGKLCFPPNPYFGNQVGWLVATGDTIEEAIDNLKGYKELLPEGVECNVAPLADLLKEVNHAEESGMEFTDQEVPTPQTVLQDQDQ